MTTLFAKFRAVADTTHTSPDTYRPCVAVTGYSVHIRVRSWDEELGAKNCSLYDKDLSDGG